MVLRKQQQKNHIHPTTNTRAHKTNKHARKQSNSSTVLSKSNQCIFKKINPRQLETTVVLIKWNYPTGTEMRQVNLRRVGRTGHKPTGAWVKVCARRSRVSSDGARGRCSLGLRGGGVGAATPAPAGRPSTAGGRAASCCQREHRLSLVWCLDELAASLSALVRVSSSPSRIRWVAAPSAPSTVRPQHRPPPPWPPCGRPAPRRLGHVLPLSGARLYFCWLTDWRASVYETRATSFTVARSSRVSAFPRVRFYFAHDRCLYVRVRCSVAAHRVLYVFHRCRPGIMQLGPGNRGRTTLTCTLRAVLCARSALRAVRLLSRPLGVIRRLKFNASIHGWKN